MKEMFHVYYEGAVSRHGNDCVDAMICVAEDADGEEVELYAEAEPDADDEMATYEPLKAEILKQAAENGVDASELKFVYDNVDGLENV